MVLAIVHHDADGVFSLALLYKKFKDINAYFSSVVKIKKILCKAIEENDSDNILYIVDIAGKPELVRLASYFKEAYWIDHHIWEKIEDVKNVKVILKEYPSATHVLAEYLKMEEEEIVRIADLVDTNSKDKRALFVRDLIGAIKWKYSKDQYLFFEKMAKEISKDINNIFENAFYNALVNSFRDWLKERSVNLITKARYYEIKENRCLFFILKERIPSFYIMDLVDERISEKFDYIFIIYDGINSRVEIRTQKGKDTYKIAKELGGGGRREASGVTLKNTSGEEAFELIVEILSRIL